MKREGRERVLVVLRPPTEESVLNVVVEQPSNRDSGPNARQVTTDPPNATTVQEGWGVEVLENLPLLAKEVERNREQGAEEETPQEAVVDSTGTEQLLGPKDTPQDGRGEEIVDVGTGEFGIICANIGELRLIIEEGCGDER